MLPHGGLPELFPPYLAELIKKTGGANGPIGKQFIAQPKLEKQHARFGIHDPLLEDENEVAPGLVYKYKSSYDKKRKSYVFNGRALWTITRHCAAYCRFCTRGREVGLISGKKGLSDVALSNTPHLSEEQIEETLKYIKNKEGLSEVILSGGDPLTVRSSVFYYVLKQLSKLQKTKKLRIIRIHTRVPVHNPHILKDEHIEALHLIQAPRVMIHVNHPLELTEATRHAIDRIRKEGGAIVMSQTVLLKGVNDSVQTLHDLFVELATVGVVPYYMYQNDAVYWAKHFTVPLPKAIAMWQELRPMLSGVAATARFVIDVAHGAGKIPVPEGNAWNIDYAKGFKDFNGDEFTLNYAD